MCIPSEELLPRVQGGDGWLFPNLNEDTLNFRSLKFAAL